MSGIGLVTIRSFTLQRFYSSFKSVDYGTLKTYCFPPESCMVEEIGDQKMLPLQDRRELNQKHSELESQYTIVASITGKGKELREEMQQANEKANAAEITLPVSKVLFLEKEFYFPIAANDLSRAFAIARSGQNIVVTTIAGSTIPEFTAQKIKPQQGKYPKLQAVK